MKSLLILGLPRSGTTPLYHAARRMVNLRPAKISAHPGHAPVEHKSGEVLYHYSLRIAQNKLSFFQRGFDADTYAEYAAVLDRYTTGTIIKDVSTLYMVKKYVDKNPSAYRVLWMRRPLPDIVTCWLDRGWFAEIRAHPKFWDCEDHDAACVSLGDKLPDTLLEGAAAVESDIFDPSWAVIEYDDFITDSRVFRDVLGGMGYPASEFNYITWTFVQKREATLRKRETALWKRLSQLS